MKKIILASGSPRRKQLLELAEIPFEVMVSNVEETFPSGLLPAQTALYIAENKAEAVKKNLGNSNAQTIIAADTIVVIDGEILGKPADSEDAFKTLRKLSGKIHKVITGVCILSCQNKILFTEEPEVEFRELSDLQIKYYVNHYRPYDKAGAYAIQEWIGAIGIKSIKGDFYNVMGLPVSRVVEELGMVNT